MTEETLGVAETPPPEDAQSSPALENSSSPEAEQTAEAQGSDSPPADAEPKRDRRQERIVELLADKSAALEYGAHMGREVARLEGELKTFQQPAPPQSTPEPKIEDFDHDQEKWTRAYSKWSLNQASTIAEAKVNETLRLRTIANEEAQLKAIWEEKSAIFTEKNPDFRSVISNPALTITKDMAATFMESEKGPEIAYHLGTHPDIAAKISRMKPRQMALAIGRLEADMSKPAPKSQSTNAPQPPNPIGGQQPNVDPTKMDVNDWVAHRREELHAKGRR